MNSPRSRRLFVGAVVVVVIGMIAVGLFLIGPPSEMRARELDRRRLETLRGASYAVDAYHVRYGHLPSTLDVLAQEAGGTASFRDPVTRQPYTYQVLDSTRYELCATFDRPSDGPDFDVDWRHAAGRHCFVLKSQPR